MSDIEALQIPYDTQIMIVFFYFATVKISFYILFKYSRKTEIKQLNYT